MTRKCKRSKFSNCFPLLHGYKQLSNAIISHVSMLSSVLTTAILELFGTELIKLELLKMSTDGCIPSQKH